MKKLKFLFIALLSVLCLVGFNSCDKDDEGNALVGTWKRTYYNGGVASSQTYIFNSDYTYEWRIEQEESDYAKGTYTYSDGILVRSSANSVNGYWSLSTATYYIQINGNTLSITSMDGSSSDIYMKQ